MPSTSPSKSVYDPFVAKASAKVSPAATRRTRQLPATIQDQSEKNTFLNPYVVGGQARHDVQGAKQGAPADSRHEKESGLLAARRALVAGDAALARQHLQRARKQGIGYDQTGDSPDLVALAIRECEQLAQRRKKEVNQPA